MKKGLVLEGGGVKGSYQVGSYYAFKDCKVKFGGYVGTSIGSFNAAMLASNKELELLDFWYNVNPGLLLGFDERYIELHNGEDLDIDSLKGAFTTLKGIVMNVGLDNTRLEKKLYELLDFEVFKNSGLDFGLVTVRLPKLEPVYAYKNDFDNLKDLCEHIVASCYLPVFRERKLIDGHYYIDGGFYDNSPVKMLADKGYKEIYVVNIKGIGINREFNRKDVKIINIKPSRDNGSILELDTSVVRDNMGYYDTLRVLKKLDGYKYCFKRKSPFFYDFIIRNVNKRVVRRVSNFFDMKSNKGIIVKAVEYILEKENIDYYDVYSISKIIKKYRKYRGNNVVYKFVSELKLF